MQTQRYNGRRARAAILSVGALMLLLAVPAVASAIPNELCVPNKGQEPVLSVTAGEVYKCQAGYTLMFAMTLEESEHLKYKKEGVGKVPTWEVVGADLRLKAAAPYETNSGNLVIDPEPGTIGGYESLDVGGKNEQTGTHHGMVTFGRSNHTSATNATITGGSFNAASAEDSTVGGGKSNTASGLNSGVFGGTLKEASLENEALL